MTTFQVIVYSIVQGVSELLPVSALAHRVAIAALVGWPMPSGIFLGALYLASALAILTYFIHDWVSMLSCTIQLVIYRKRPMTLDERMPLFLLLATLPVSVAWYYGSDEIAALLTDSHALLGVGVLLAVFTLPLVWADGWGRKNRGMFDWSIKDSLAVGFAQALSVLPGCGRTNGAYFGGLMRNFTRESAAKFGYFASLPVFTLGAVIHLRDFSFHPPEPMTDLSWMSLAVGFLVAYFASLLAINGFNKFVQGGQNATMGRYGAYRFALAAAMIGLYFYRARTGG